MKKEQVHVEGDCFNIWYYSKESDINMERSGRNATASLAATTTASVVIPLEVVALLIGTWCVLSGAQERPKLLTPVSPTTALCYMAL